MSCELVLCGRSIPCKDAIGGIKAVYMLDPNHTKIMFGTGINSDDVISITDTDGVAPAVAYKYMLKGTQSNLTQNIQSSIDSGTAFYEQVLTLALQRMSRTMAKEIKLLVYNHPYIVVENYNSEAFLVGARNGAEVTGGSILTGGAKSDFNGYNLTFTGEERAPASWLPSATDPTNVFSGLPIEPTVIVDGCTYNMDSATADGTYTVGTALAATNTITVNIKGADVGKAWSISSDTVNGMSWTGSGIFVAPAGDVTVTLDGTGIPIAEGQHIVTLTDQDGAKLQVPVTVVT